MMRSYPTPKTGAAFDAGHTKDRNSNSSTNDFSPSEETKQSPAAPANAKWVPDFPWKPKGHGVWILTVRKCPHCGAKHVHGGGDGLVPDFGHRVAHCGAAGGYILVDARCNHA